LNRFLCRAGVDRSTPASQRGSSSVRQSQIVPQPRYGEGCLLKPPGIPQPGADSVKHRPCQFARSHETKLPVSKTPRRNRLSTVKMDRDGTKMSVCQAFSVPGFRALRRGTPGYQTAFR
jgi:hypothetical protein